MRTIQVHPDIQQLVSAIDVRSIFERPKLLVLQDIAVNVDDLPASPFAKDPKNLIKNYLRTEQVVIQNLETPIASTVLLASEADRSKGEGTGEVVDYKGKKYLITATHVIGKKCFGKPTKLQIYERVSGTISQKPLEEMEMVYSTQIAKELELPIGDVAIFQYDGQVDGVEIGDITERDGLVGSFAIGYPARFINEWAQDLNPLLSFGFASLKAKRGSSSAYVNQLIAIRARLDSRFAKEVRERHLAKVIFSGVTLPGNSGGGLYNLQGKLIAVCRGPEGPLGRETGLEEFYPIKKIFEELEQKKLLG